MLLLSVGILEGKVGGSLGVSVSEGLLGERSIFQFLLIIFLVNKYFEDSITGKMLDLGNAKRNKTRCLL